jgi:hypothetical protein
MQSRGVKDCCHTCLGNSNDIVTKMNGRQCVLLNRGWNFVSSQDNIAQHDRVEGRIFERVHWMNASRAFLDNLNLSDAAKKLGVSKACSNPKQQRAGKLLEATWGH